MPVSKPLGAGCSHQAPCLRFRKDASSHGFRGEQYSHAIALFQRKFANSAPPNIDVLVEQRLLRKKYKDPITRRFRADRDRAATGGSAAQAGTQAGRAAVQDGAADSEPIPVLPMTPHGGARQARNRALMMVMERSRGGGLH